MVGIHHAKGPVRKKKETIKACYRGWRKMIEE
jgi:hypothetical protein